MKIRECVKEDYPQLVDFWNNNSGWDYITRDIWEQRFIRTPFGPSVVVVAEENNTIVAQLIFILFKINLGDIVALGCKPFAAVIDRSVRSLVGYKYIFQLYSFGG